MHIYIATPALSGSVHIPYAISLMETNELLKSKNIKVTNKVVKSSSLLVAERNRLVEAFWQSDATHMLCIDSDLGWPPQAVLEMLKQDKEFIVGVYPSRTGKSNDFVFRAQENSNGSVKTDKHLIKADYVPAGFMLIARSAFVKMRETFPELYFEPKKKYDIGAPISGYCFFDTEIYDGEFWGEDYVFCRRARKSGVDIWIDPLIGFDHAGNIGMLQNVLTNKPPPNKINQFNNVIDMELKEAA